MAKAADRQGTRVISHSEVDAALTCWARWDFAYGGRLAGSTLKPKTTAPVLSEGRAWGAAVATWHQHANERLTAGLFAHEALSGSLDADQAEMLEAGLPPLPEARREMGDRLGAMLDHYIATAVPLPNLTRLEERFEVGIPARKGPRVSSRFRFSGYIDGWTDDDGHLWIVENKLRSRLSDPRLLELQRQHRWYAWAYAQRKGATPIGVIIEERLNEVPKPARTVQGRRKGEDRAPSHAKDQLCTPESYIDLCHEYGELPRHDVVTHLEQREWQRRFPLMFRDGELEEAGLELVAAARLISELDAGLYPIRHASQMNCGGCRFREICAAPDDDLLVEALFTRTEPKRLRDKEGEA